MIWAALLVLVMICFVGLSIDTAKLALNVHQLQNASDAASLAGVQIVKTHSHTATLLQTANIGFANKAENLPVKLRQTLQPDPFPGNTAPYDILLGRWVIFNRTFLPTLNAPNAVKVIARRNTNLGPTAPALGLVFGPIAGVNTADASREAVAFCQSSNGAGLIVLSQTAVPGFHITGNANLIVNGGGIHVNATAIGRNRRDGAWISNNAVIDAGFLNVVGGITPDPMDPTWAGIFSNGGVGGFPVQDHTHQIQHINDPLASTMLARGDPYLDASGTRLDLPTLLQGPAAPFTSWYARWNASNASYDLFDPANPNVYMLWNGLTYAQQSFGASDSPSQFRDTVGKATDPITGLLVNVDASVTLPPGYYPNGTTIQNNDHITLDPTDPTLGVGKPPIYLFGGGPGPNNNNIGLYMTGGSLTGHGVTCYVTQTFDYNTGAALPVPVAGLCRMTGGVVDLDSPGDWQNWQNQQAGFPVNLSLVDGLNGIAIWQDPLIPGPPDVHLNGNGNFDIDGTVYFPDPIHCRFEGDLGDTGNQILCGSAEIMGTAKIVVSYDGRNHGTSPSHCYLVD